VRLLVCGSRNYEDLARMQGSLDALLAVYGVDVVIEGEALGADLMARAWAEVNKIPVEPYPADWNKYGKSAGPIRNRQMLEEGKPDLVVAFPIGKLTESRGTFNMVTLASKAGVRVIVVGLDDRDLVAGNEPPLTLELIAEEK
jgi:hypothetical protein